MEVIAHQNNVILDSQWTLSVIKDFETRLDSTIILLPFTDKAFQITIDSETVLILIWLVI